MNRGWWTNRKEDEQSSGAQPVRQHSPEMTNTVFTDILSVLHRQEAQVCVMNSNLAAQPLTAAE